MYLLVLVVGHVDDGHTHVDAHAEREQHGQEEQERLRVPHAQTILNVTHYP